MKKILNFLILIMILLTYSCEDLTELNVNPNGVTVEKANPNMLLTTVLSESAKVYLENGTDNIAGAMQYTQKATHFSSHNDYGWNPEKWDGYYSLLRNNSALYDMVVEKGYEFHQGVALVMKSFLFGQITDLWGDAPYTDALKGGGDNPVLLPAYSPQDEIYKGIIEDLKKASGLLSKSKDEYQGIDDNSDLYYNGDPEKWRKFANSLQLRYYMRVSSKLEDYAKDGINEIIGNEPVFENNGDDVTMGFIGTASENSWPDNIEYRNITEFWRYKICNTFLETLRTLDDPRLEIWVAPVEIQTRVDQTDSEGIPYGHDEVYEDSEGNTYRNVLQSTLDDLGIEVNTNKYVGLPASEGSPVNYNLYAAGSTSGSYEGYNPHVSLLAEMYQETKGDLLRARLMSYSEVEFILAEAALELGVGGSAQQHYENAIQASLNTWGVGDDYTDYYTGDVIYNASQEQIIEQKWISLWTCAQEAWFDYRRSGFPELVTGSHANKPVLPIRFRYGSGAITNTDNYNAAIDKLEATDYSSVKNSAWDKMWLLQGIDKPW